MLVRRGQTGSPDGMPLVRLGRLFGFRSMGAPVGTDPMQTDLCQPRLSHAQAMHGGGFGTNHRERHGFERVSGGNVALASRPPTEIGARQFARRCLQGENPLNAYFIAIVSYWCTGGYHPAEGNHISLATYYERRRGRNRADSCSPVLG